MLSDYLAWPIAILVSMVFTVFNVLTIFVILNDRRLRGKTSNYPVLSFLVASALQGLIAVPLYIFKKLAYDDDVPGWLCDTSRFTYMLCGHLLKMSLLLVSFDRYFAVKFPFKYAKLVARRNMFAVILAFWLVTIVVDGLPFNHRHYEGEKCRYVPTQAWGLSVILAYNIVPLCLIAFNYASIWCVAMKVNMSDQKSQICLSPDKKNAKKSKVGLIFEMKATKTSLVLLMVYVVCWLPLGVFYMIDHFCHNCLSSTEKLDRTRAAIKILSSTSSVFAPIIYCWCNAEYRNAARKILVKFGVMGSRREAFTM